MNLKFALLVLMVVVVSRTDVAAQIKTADVPISAPFDSTYIVGTAVTDTFDIGQHFQSYSNGQFVVCQNSTLCFQGNQSSTMPTFFVLAGAKLILKDTYFYPTIYLGHFAELHAENGSQNIQLYRQSSSLLYDTSNCNFLFDSLFSTVNFTFTTWPNSNSPCTLSPNSLSTHHIPNASIRTKGKYLECYLPNNEAARLTLYDISGKVLLHQTVKSRDRIDISHIRTGLYIAKLYQNKKQHIQKVSW